MRVKIFIPLILLLSAGYLQQNNEDLNLINPTKIVIGESKLFISDEYKIKIFDFKELNLIKEIGKKGEGPGEFNRDPDIRIIDNKIFAHAYTKIYWFDESGELIKEIRLPFMALKILPIKNKYVTLEFHNQMEINLYNDNFNKIISLYKELGVDLNRLNPLQSNLDFDVNDSNIFIAEPQRGFVIEVFDDNGKRMYVIKKDYPKIKLQDWYKERIFESLSRNPYGQEIKKRIVFPEYFPLISSLFIDGKFIYVRTFKKENDRFEFIVFDLKGNELIRKMLPEANIYTFKNGCYYWLISDDNTGKYKVYKEKILK